MLHADQGPRASTQSSLLPHRLAASVGLKYVTGTSAVDVLRTSGPTAKGKPPLPGANRDPP